MLFMLCSIISNLQLKFFPTRIVQADNLFALEYFSLHFMSDERFSTVAKIIRTVRVINGHATWECHDVGSLISNVIFYALLR